MTKKTFLAIDDTAVIPPAIRAAAAKADAAHKAAYGTPVVEVVEPIVPPVEPVVAAVVKPVEPVIAPVEPVVDPTVTPVVTTTIVPPVNDWEHKFKSMEGRFARQSTQLRQMSEQLTQTRALLATTPEAPARQPAELNPKSLLTPAEIAEYGAEFVDVVRRAGAESVSPELDQIRQELAGLRQSSTQTAASLKQDAKVRMYSELSRDIPDWKGINSDDNFLNWLALPDTYSGAIRQTLLTAAYEACDAGRVAAFFQGFLAEEAATIPRTVVPDQTIPAIVPDPKVPLERFAAPGRAKAAAGLTPPVEKPVFTRAHIAAFYADVNANKFRGNDVEKNRIETMIFDAQREGRIR